MSEEINPNYFPSNSFKSKKEALEKSEKRVTKIVQGRIQKKKSLADRFASAVYSDDTKNIISYILYDVLIPAAKSTITEMISGGIEMLFYGEARRNNIRRDGSRSYVSYSSYSRDDRSRPRERRDTSSLTRLRQRFDDIVLDRRSDAEEVLSGMQDLIDQYDVCRVSDLYDLVGIPGEYTDNKYGWDNIADAYAKRVPLGYTLILPRPIIID